jgi:HPt (histidine-containing phosphotransfer) domain-containing protein
MKDSTPARFIFNKHLDARFLDELFDGDWQDVETAYDNQDLAGVRTSIHKCKTLFGYVGFSDIQQLCQEFENRCSEKPIAELAPGYQVLVNKKEEARHIIESEYERLKIFNAADS